MAVLNWGLRRRQTSETCELRGASRKLTLNDALVPFISLIRRGRCRILKLSYCVHSEMLTERPAKREASSTNDE